MKQVTYPSTRVTRSLKPGQDGTLKLARRFGEALICVRYREDANGRLRYTTVELVVDTSPVQRRLSRRCIVQVRIAWGEPLLRQRAMALGAKWNPAARLWRMSLGAAQDLQLLDRIRPPLDCA